MQKRAVIFYAVKAEKGWAEYIEGSMDPTLGNDTSFPLPVYPCKVPAKKPAGTGMQVRATCLGVGNRYLFKD